MPHKDPAVRKAYLREFHKRWYEANEDRRRAQIRQYKRANPAKIAEYRSRPEVRAINTANKRKWRHANLERDRATKRIWAKNNRERLREYDKRYRSDRTEYNRRYYAANRDRYLWLARLQYIRKRDGVSKEQYELMAAFGKAA